MNNSVCFYSASWKGGSGWFVHELALAMAKAGADVTLVSPEADPPSRDPRHPRLQRLLLPQGASGSGSRLYRAYRSLRRVALSFPMLLKGRARSRTFLVTHTDWLMVAVMQFIWIRLLGARLIFIIHDVTPHAWGFPKMLQWLERALLSLTYRLPNHLVTLTEAARTQLLAEYPVKPQNATVIPHGAFRGEGALVPIPGNRLVLVFGMLRRNKRILETIQAMALLPAQSKVRLLIAGAPHAQDMAYWEECREALKPLGDRVVTEIGFVPEDRVATLLAQSDAMILPYEEFNSQSGVAILATFAERPLIATKVGGIGELIGKGLEAVEVRRPVTAASIAEALMAFEARSVDELRAMAARSCGAIGAYLDWDRIGCIYEQLAAGSDRTGSRQA